MQFLIPFIDIKFHVLFEFLIFYLQYRTVP